MRPAPGRYAAAMFGRSFSVPSLAKACSRAPCFVPGALVAAALMLPAADAGAARIVDQGPLGGSRPCSLVPSVDSTCLIPFGPPAPERAVLSGLEVGSLEAERVLIARPIASVPGQWTVIVPPTGADRWRAVTPKPPGPITRIDTAIAVEPGDQLVLVNPRVVETGAVTDLDLPDAAAAADDRLVAGASVAITPAGRAIFEPDADGDGWGDETQDLCPGVSGRECAGGVGQVVVTGAQYVPSRQPVQIRWTATNVGDAPQPFVLNLGTKARNPEFQSPPGVTCGPGFAPIPTDVFVPPATRSSLITDPPGAPRSSPVVPESFPYSVRPGTTWIHCRLPVLQPGASLSGVVGGTGWASPTPFYGVEAVLLAPFLMPWRHDAAIRVAHTVVVQADRDVPQRRWRPVVMEVGRVAKNGKVKATVRCGGLVDCTLTGSLRSAVGRKLLGRSVAPVTARRQGMAEVTLQFSAAGLRWWSKHRRSRIDVEIVSAWPDETPVTGTKRLRPQPSKAMAKALSRRARQR